MACDMMGRKESAFLLLFFTSERRAAVFLSQIEFTHSPTTTSSPGSSVSVNGCAHDSCLSFLSPPITGSSTTSSNCCLIYSVLSIPAEATQESCRHSVQNLGDFSGTYRNVCDLKKIDKEKNPQNQNNEIFTKIVTTYQPHCVCVCIKFKS